MSSSPQGLSLKPTKGSLKISVKLYFLFNDSSTCLKGKNNNNPTVLQSNNLHVWSRVKQNEKTAKHFEILLLDLVKIVHALKLLMFFFFEHIRGGDMSRGMPQVYSIKIQRRNLTTL